MPEGRESVRCRLARRDAPVMTTTLLTPTPPPTLLRPPVAAGPLPPLPTQPRLRRLRYEPEPGEVPSDPPPTSVPMPPVALPDRAERADAHRGVTRLLRLALEVFDGHRPLAHLAPHVEPHVLRYWRAAVHQRGVPAAPSPGGRLRTRPGRPHVFLPGNGVAEVAVTCRMDGRARALAARFERDDRTWRCVAIRLL